jgi:hypothetical protein
LIGSVMVVPVPVLDQLLVVAMLSRKIGTEPAL